MSRRVLAGLLILVGPSAVTGCSDCSDCEQDAVHVAAVRVYVAGVTLRPLPDVQVALTAPGFSAVQGRTGSDGLARLELPGTATGQAAIVHATAPTGLDGPESQSVTLVADSTLDASFVFVPH